jgi:pimeloyl-ACP methyl ester carboxylesterase
MLPALAPLHTAGFAVLLVDARCHGQSDDAAFTSLPRFAEDIEAGLDWLRKKNSVDAKRLAVMGHSVGAGAALLCATRRPDVRAVISLSAFAHPREIMKTYLAEAHIPYPVLGWYVMRHVQAVIGARFDDLAPLASMAQLRCPVLLVHGSDDELVPFADAQRRTGGPLAGISRIFVEGAGRYAAPRNDTPDRPHFLPPHPGDAVKAFQDYYPEHVAHCYGCGTNNSHGHQIKTHWVGDEVVTLFTPEPYQMSVPGFAYGGLIASLIDCHGTATAAAI